MRLRIPLAVLAALFLSSPALAQQADVIRGRVIGPDSVPVEGAAVTATSIGGNVSRNARTDRSGRFTITFPGGEGDYMVSITALGFAPKRFEVKRSADEEILMADARLTRAAVALDAMKVTAQREKVARNDAPPDISGSEKPVTSAALPAADLGDLAAMAATLPGVQLVPGENGDPNGFSVLGLGADQNNMTLNGMNFGGTNLPRDANISSSLVTSPYDVSRGGFSGAQFTLRTRAGSNFITRGMSMVVDQPSMQWTDRAAQALGQQYSNLSLGGVSSGPIALDKAFYNLSYQLGRRANDYQSLLNTDPLGLQTAGVSSDSVTRLIQILSQQQIPTVVGGRLPHARNNDQGTVFGSFDFAPPSSTNGQAFGINFNGNWNRQSPTGGFPTDFPAYGGDRTSWRAGVQGSHNTYFGFGILSETSVGISQNRNYSNPYLDMPAGRVRVASDFDDGTSGVQTLSFGGSPFMSSRQTTTSVGYLNQMSWFSANNKHRLKLTSELRREAYSQEQANNTLGTYSYNSLADLEAGLPSSFTRQLSPRTSGASQLIGAVSLGDAFRPTRDLQIQYGLRLDGNHFLSAPAENPDVERIFGLRNDRVPSHIYASPRVGFSWTYGATPQISGFEGAARAPRAVVRGGAGVFQNTPQTTIVGSALDNTGLPAAVQQLNCVGVATPQAAWGVYSAGSGGSPDRCADGTLGTVFANNSPNVNLFSNDYVASRSVRSNLQWNGPVLDNRLSATIDATYSRNLNQQGIVDLNFNPAARFALASEGGRPIFVQETSIVPQSGAIASRDARVSPLFSRVTETLSDLVSESRQASLRISPVRFSTNFNWSVSYVYSNVRERVRGFGFNSGSNNTAGNPLDVEWARSSFDSRHQIVYNLGFNFWDAVRVSWYGQFRSGGPFTPMISGDVNGDGYSNDRAFVFDPASTPDPQLAGDMQNLLDNGSRAARSCLLKQRGNLAERNSCEGPWTSTANLSVSFNPVKVRMPQRASISFNISNPLGAADLAMHGSNKLHGWGQAAIPDNALLYVRGYDQANQRYRYQVNQRFGATNPAFSAFRAPVTLTAMLRFDVGPTRERQSLTMQLDRGRKTQGSKLPEGFIKAIYGMGGIPNPMGQILRQQDSLHLTAKQADSIAMINRWYTVRVDSIWTPVAKYLSDLPETYDQGDAYDHYLAARRASVDLLAKLTPTVKSLLTPEQIRKLPPFIAGYLDTRYLASIRSGTASFTASSTIPGGAVPAVGGAVDVVRAGGGAATVIIRSP